MFCVPQSGFAKGKGFRAEFLKDKTDVVDLDHLVKEAMDNGVTSIYPVEEPRKNRAVILGQDFLIRGNSLTLAKHTNVSVNVYDPFKREG